MLRARVPTEIVSWTASWKRLRCLALVASALACPGCAWFKSAPSIEDQEVNLREDPQETRFRPKKEGGKHFYGGLSSEANAIERSLGY
jgi:hypothetical protein